MSCHVRGGLEYVFVQMMMMCVCVYVWLCNVI